MNRLPILTYHSLDDGGSPISIAPSLFRWQMEYLRANGWRTLTLDELMDGHQHGSWLECTFALTFDDGFENFAEHALPVLRGCGFSATVVVVADWVGRTNDWPSQPSWTPRLPLMDWDALRAMADAGMTIGAHTLSHPHLPRLIARDAEREIVESQRLIAERIGCAVETFAYPYGDTSPALEAVVAQRFRAGFGTRLACATPTSHTTAFERVDAYYLRDKRLWRAMGTGWLECYLQARRWIRNLKSEL